MSLTFQPLSPFVLELSVWRYDRLCHTHTHEYGLERMRRSERIRGWEGRKWQGFYCLWDMFDYLDPPPQSFLSFSLSLSLSLSLAVSSTDTIWGPICYFYWFNSCNSNTSIVYLITLGSEWERERRLGCWKHLTCTHQSKQIHTKSTGDTVTSSFYPVFVYICVRERRRQRDKTECNGILI